MSLLMIMFLLESCHMIDSLMPMKVFIRDFSQAYYIPTEDAPHMKQWRVKEKLGGLLSRYYPRDDVNLRFSQHDGFYGPDKIPDTVLFANDWVLPYATAWLFTSMEVRPGLLRIKVPEIENPRHAALVEIPVRVTEQESLLSSMFRLVFLTGLEDLK